MSTLSALLVVTEEVFIIWFDCRSHTEFPETLFFKILGNLVLGREGCNTVVAISLCLVWYYCKSMRMKKTLLFLKSPLFKGDSGEWDDKWMEDWIPDLLSVCTWALRQAWWQYSFTAGEIVGRSSEMSTFL